MDNRKQIAYEYLHNAIVSYKLPPGSSIVENDISNYLNISRTPVREALKQLESEGLVRHIPGRGAFVSEITTQDVEEIFSLREALEVLALHVALNVISNDEIRELEELLHSCLPDCKPERFFESDRRLHDLIVRHGGNRRLHWFLNTINSQIERIRCISAMRPNRLEKSKLEHLAILEAIKERNLSQAEKQLRLHIRNVKASTLEVCRTMWVNGK